MHLVVITSVVRPHNLEFSVFSPEERFQQLLESVRSVCAKIADSFVVVVEQSRYSENQLEALQDAGAQAVHYTATMLKQIGEPKSLLDFFHSELFSIIQREIDIQSITKLSGRYVLQDDFVFHYDGDFCVCKVVEPAESYSGMGFVQTFFYSLPIKYFEGYLKGLERCCLEGIFMNLEHSFYLYQAIPLNKVNREIAKIHVGGRIAPSGDYVEI